VPNLLLRSEYQRRYGVESTVVHNACEIAEPAERCDIQRSGDEGGSRIVYTGAIYHANHDAFRNLLAALQQLGRPNVKLHLYTSQARTELEREDIRGPIEYHNHIPPPQVAEAQRCADILFLPLAFHSGIPEAIRTAAPGKMGEYLASMRPILVHAPEDSFVSRYFKEHECGVVVDRNEIAALAGALEKLLDDARLRERVVRNARERALVDFGLDNAQRAFRRVFRPELGE
jgi:glycosyltransferase involved in cell wall biosynthesis